MRIRTIAKILTVFLGISVMSARIQAGQQYFADTGHWYEAVYAPQGIKWDDASGDAQTRGGHLATVHSEAENQFILGLVNDSRYWNMDPEHTPWGPWLGGFQASGAAEPAGGWQWVTGESFSYTNWRPPQPDNGWNIENHLHMYDNFPGGSGRWNDICGTWALNSYIVEYKPTGPPPNKTHVLAFGSEGSTGLAGAWAATTVANSFSKFKSVESAEGYALNYTATGLQQSNSTFIAAKVAAARDRVQAGDTFVLYLTAHGEAEVFGQSENSVNKETVPVIGNRQPNAGDEYLAIHDSGDVLDDDMLARMFMTYDSDAGEYVEDEHWASVHKLFIIDSCFSGGFWGNSETDEGDLNKLSNVALIAAAPEDEYAVRLKWWPSAGGGIGTLTLGLLGALDDLEANDRVTFGDLYDKIWALKSEYDSNDMEKGIIGGEEFWDDTFDLSGGDPVRLVSDSFQLSLGVPEPGTLGLLAVGGLAFLRRKRR